MKTRHRPQQLSFDGHCEGYLHTRGEIKKLQRPSVASIPAMLQREPGERFHGEQDKQQAREGELAGTNCNRD
jgi:hypothetical protein